MCYKTPWTVPALCVLQEVLCLLLSAGSFPSLGSLSHTHALISAELKAWGGAPECGLSVCGSFLSGALPVWILSSLASSVPQAREIASFCPGNYAVSQCSYRILLVCFPFLRDNHSVLLVVPCLKTFFFSCWFCCLRWEVQSSLCYSIITTSRRLTLYCFVYYQSKSIIHIMNNKDDSFFTGIKLNNIYKRKALYSW